MLGNETAQGSAVDTGATTTVRVVFPDLHGVSRGKDVPAAEFDRVAEHGICFCSAVMGTDLRHNAVVGAEKGYPDMRAVPDIATLVPLPWEPGVSVCIADLLRVSDERPQPTDPRGALKRAVAEFAELGYFPLIGPELEFYMCRIDDAEPSRVTRFVDRLSMVYAVGPRADPGGVVRGIAESLSRLGLGAFAANHEFCNSQYEINLWEGRAVTAADRAFLVKTAVKDVAALSGLLATFMGMPFNDQGGSGFHVHVSLEREGRNSFADPDDPDGISPAMRSFIAGVLLHTSALMALLNPTVNAYRRIVSDPLAPKHANWGWDNRLAMVRVPPERGGATRIEVRLGDGSANPYLTVAAILFAGLHGVRESLPLQPPIAGDGTGAAPDERGIPLARSLEASLAALEQDEVLRALLSPELVDTFLQLKRHEIARHQSWVSDWEIEEYLRHL
jgi:glutamine synthetase